MDSREEHPQPPEGIVYPGRTPGETGRTTPFDAPGEGADNAASAAGVSTIGLMTLQALLAVSTIALVFARAVNVLR
jgi:hypothetical protein